MNIQQFQYIVALAEHRHFEMAAEKCFISQSTLSTMISKFEDEIGITIFDRKRKPVGVTKEGQVLISQIKLILKRIEEFNEMTSEMKGEVRGRLSIAVIPTVAPYLLPLFLHQFAQKFPFLEIEVRELTTSEIIRRLKLRELDIGIVSTPIDDKELREIELYREPFLFYNLADSSQGAIHPDEIDVNKLFLLEEGHCLRTQVLALCDIYTKKDKDSTLNFNFKAGSMDSLLRFVKANKGSTLVPYLTSIDFSETDKSHLSTFSNPKPFRSVGLLVHQHFVKESILKNLTDAIMNATQSILPKLNDESLGLHPMRKTKFK